ncbi:MAG: type I phosphomannose isomerase catalytic subunit [Candidatus Dormibacteria bacterium]|jgi:mannose-6-phosphate isomerase
MTAPGRGATADAGSRAPLYPLRFEPIFEYRLWGGRRLARLLAAPLPGDGPIGEAWVLSDRPDHQSRVASGPLAGLSLSQLLEEFPEQMLGPGGHRFRRFPLLLKFLDAQKLLSVQVHPSDRQTSYLPAGETGKNEAWVVLEAGPEGRIYAGLQPGTTPESLRRALSHAAIGSQLAGFTPKSGDAVFLPAGTVHSLGGDVVVFEVQQNSDVTFRLCDWDRVDPATGRPRALQVDQALACTDFAQKALGPVLPVMETTTPVRRERLFDCEHFSLRRLQGELPFSVGAAGILRILVCIGGSGQVEYGGAAYAIARGDVLLLPAVVGACTLRPRGPVNVLEVALGESSTTHVGLAPEPAPDLTGTPS